MATDIELNAFAEVVGRFGFEPNRIERDISELSVHVWHCSDVGVNIVWHIGRTPELEVVRMSDGQYIFYRQPLSEFAGPKFKALLSAIQSGAYAFVDDSNGSSMSVACGFEARLERVE